MTEVDSRRGLLKNSYPEAVKNTIYQLNLQLNRPKLTPFIDFFISLCRILPKSPQSKAAEVELFQKM